MTLDINYSSDAPVQTKEQDEFARWPFAERIANIIAERADPSSIIVGLYGTWGEGKTSVLNFIENVFADDENIVCIRFNPWRYGTEEQLLTGFFFDIANAIDTTIVDSSEKIADLIRKVAPAVIGAIGHPSIGEGVAQLLSGPTLDELKNRIETALVTTKKRVVVLVDDIDRLDKDEIQATFRLVKLTADFKHTA